MMRQLEAQELAYKLLRDNNLYDWKVEFNKSPTTLGQCWFHTKVIAMSTTMLNSVTETEVKDTILHEIAHALTGPEHRHHTHEWKKVAQSIGCTGDVCGAMHIPQSRATPQAEQKEKTHIPPLSKKCPTCGATAIEKARANFGKKTFLKLECGHLVGKENLVGGASFEEWESKSGKHLYPYQVDGAKFIAAANGRCLVADEPALGKTVQAISFLHHYRDIALPALWMCKTKLKLQTLKENFDWAGFVPQIISKSGFYPLPNMGVYIVSFDLLRRIKQDKLDALGIKTVVFDEIQHIANPESARTQEVRRIVNSVDFFIALSGTPWKNRASEYFSVLNMLAPEKFPSVKHFKNKWVDTVYDPSTGKYREGGIRNIPAFREETKHFVIRRMRADVLPDLPPINRTIRYVELEDVYGEAYEKAEGKVAEIVKDLMLEGSSLNMASMAAEMMKLKHITGLAKVDAQVEDAIEFLEDTDDWQKLTIFHHHVDVGDDLEIKLNTWLVANGYQKVLRLLGGMKDDDIFRIIKQFRNEEKSRLLIASTLASGEGIDGIQICQNASMMERQWNPANEEQAEFRFSRPINFNETPIYLQPQLFDIETKKQKKVSIRVPYMICANTIDEMLTNLIEHKRVNFRKTMNVGEEELQFSESSMIQELAEAIVRKRYGKKIA